MRKDFLDVLEAYSEVRVSKLVERRLADIELALTHGYTHRQIIEQLHREGIVITSAYYHRLIPRLRGRVKRDALTPERSGNSTPGGSTSSTTQGEGMQVSETQQPRGNQSASTGVAPLVSVPHTSGAKALKLPVALAKSSPDAASTINVESSGPKPFTWSGREFLNKDWSKIL